MEMYRKERDIPGQHTSKSCPWASRDQEADGGVCYGVPRPPHKQDDRGVEGIQLGKQKSQTFEYSMTVQTQLRMFNVTRNLAFKVYFSRVRRIAKARKANHKQEANW